MNPYKSQLRSKRRHHRHNATAFNWLDAAWGPSLSLWINLITRFCRCGGGGGRELFMYGRRRKEEEEPFVLLPSSLFLISHIALLLLARAKLPLPAKGVSDPPPIDNRDGTKRRRKRRRMAFLFPPSKLQIRSILLLFLFFSKEERKCRCVLLGWKNN